jgi:hypothetical protein
VGDIIQFPKRGITYPDRVYKEKSQIEKIHEDSIRQLHSLHVNETVEDIIPIIFRYLSSAGFDLATINNIKEGAFIVESIRSALLQFYDINHPFQKLSDEIFEQVDEDLFKIVSKLNIELDPEEDIEEIEG